MSQRSPVIPDMSPVHIPVGGLYRTEDLPNTVIGYSAVRQDGVFVLKVSARFLPGDGFYVLATMAYFASSDGGVGIGSLLNGSPQPSVYRSEEEALRMTVANSITTIRAEREKATAEMRTTAPDNTYAELVSAVEKCSRSFSDPELLGFHVSAVRSKLKEACLMALKTSYEIAVRGATMDEVLSVISEGLARHVMRS